MADFSLLLEAEKRGILPPDKAPLLAEARKRGLIPGGDAAPATAPRAPAQSNDPNPTYSRLSDALKREPGYEYGSILPVRKKEGGPTELGLPDWARSLAQGGVDLIEGTRTGELTPEATGALLTAGSGGRIAAKAPAGFVERFVTNKAMTPEAKGAAFVQNIANQSGKDIHSLPNSTRGQTVAEALGGHAETHLMSMGRREGTTGDALAAALTERGAARPDRILDDMATSAGIHPEAAKGNIEALVKDGQDKAGPLFKTALEGKGAVWNDDLARLAKRPAIKQAIKLAEEDLRNADIDPKTLGLDGETVPTAEAWDAIRRSLAKSVERDTFGKPIPDSVSAGNHNINQSVRDLTAALKTAIPGYENALAVSGEYLSARSAFEFGQKEILNPKVTSAQFATKLKRLTDADREALKGGIANRLFEMSQNGKIAPAKFLTKNAQEKLGAALGDEQAAAFIRTLDEEMKLGRFETRANPAAGSQTYSLSQAAKDADSFGEGGISKAVLDAASKSGGSPTRGAMHLAGSALYHGGQRLLDALRSKGLDTEGRNVAGQILSSSPPNELATVLKNYSTPSDGPKSKAAQLAEALRIARGLKLPAATAYSTAQGQRQ